MPALARARERSTCASPGGAGLRRGAEPRAAAPARAGRVQDAPGLGARRSSTTAAATAPRGVIRELAPRATRASWASSSRATAVRPRPWRPGSSRPRGERDRDARRRPAERPGRPAGADRRARRALGRRRRLSPAPPATRFVRRASLAHRQRRAQLASRATTIRDTGLLAQGVPRRGDAHDPLVRRHAPLPARRCCATRASA